MTIQMQQTDPVVLLGEFARAVGVAKQTAYLWAVGGKIPAVFRGGRYEIDRSAMGEAVKERKAAMAARACRTDRRPAAA